MWFSTSRSNRRYTACRPAMIPFTPRPRIASACSATRTRSICRWSELKAVRPGGPSSRRAEEWRARTPAQNREGSMSNDDAVVRLLTDIRDNELVDIELRRMAIDDSRKAVEFNRRFQTLAARRVRTMMVMVLGTFVISFPLLAGGIWLILNAGSIAKSMINPPASTRTAP